MGDDPNISGDGDREANRTETYEVSGTTSERVRNYRVLRKLGEGGMGEVWEARQEEPVRRRVALKLIKPGMESRSVLARFESERQALAMMNHPSIARVYDAGLTDRERPYFAMEYVEGVPISTYCDLNRLDTRRRLELFAQVCEGVQHAHQKGVIHRDLKPSNILVSEQDGKPVPKIIDFGVAKATEHRLTEKTVYTELGQLVGTPEYMSPEQAEMSGLDVDTRTDVYSLGVVLYELLVGTQPFDSTELRKAGLDEIRRKIREDDPPRPSTRVSTLGGEASTASARNRRTDVSTLKRALKGDLDWITMKALEKDRTRRYGSPSELAADVRRYLDDQPVLASNPGVGYRVGKFVRRHRFGVAAAASIVAALLVGLVTTSVALVRARTAEAAAKRDAETARQVSDFVIGLFEVADPGETLGNTITAREILDSGAQRIRTELAEQPAVRATMMHTIGRVYANLGLYDSAAPLLEEAQRLRREGSDPAALAETLVQLSALQRIQADYEAAEASAREAVRLERARKPGDVEATATALQELGGALLVQGSMEEAEGAAREAVALARTVEGGGGETLAQCLVTLGEVLKNRAEYDEAEQVLLEALDLHRSALHQDHPRISETLQLLGVLYQEKRDFEAAERIVRETLERDRRVMGEDHPNVTMDLYDLASILEKRERYVEAEELMREVIRRDKAQLGEEHPYVAIDLNNLAISLMDLERFDEAAATYEEALAIQRKALGAEHYEVATTLSNHGVMLLNMDRPAEAEPLLREGLAIRRKVYGDVHPHVALSLSLVARAVEAQGQLEAAERYQREALAIHRQTMGDRSPAVADDLGRLAGTLRKADRPDEAEALLRESLRIWRSIDQQTPRFARTLSNLGGLLTDQGRATEAEAPFREGLAMLQGLFPDEPWRTADIRSALGACLGALGRYDEAEQELMTAHQLQVGHWGDAHESARRTSSRLAHLYDETGRSDEAAVWRARAGS